jgi:PAS domain S-box-containing protein
VTFRPPPWVRYAAAAALAISAQLARSPLPQPTAIPFITFVPFILLAGCLGWGPGLLATGLCVLEALYFDIEPVGSLAIREPYNWVGLALLTLTGLVANLEFERLRRAKSALRRALQEVQADHSLLDAIFSAQSDSALVFNAQGEIIRTNPAARACFGFEPAGANLGQFLRKFPIAGGLESSLTQRALRGEPDARGEQEAGERILETSSVPMRGSKGTITGAVTISRDITDRKNSENAIRTAHAELNAIYASAPVVLFVVDEQLRIEKLNERAAQLAGQSACALIGLGPGDAMGCAVAGLERRGCGNSPLCQDCRIRATILDTLQNGTRHQGVEAWAPWSIPMKEEPMCLLVSTAAIQLGSSRKALVCAQEITELKGAQRELHRQAELVNLSHDAIVTADAHRIIVGWNRGAEEMYGWTEKEALKTRLPDLLETVYHVPADEVDETLAREGRWEGEIEHRRRDGRRILLDSRQVLLRDANRAPSAILEINREITERRRAEEALQESVRDLRAALAEKTVLLKEVHHRVKNNLAVISSLLSLKAEATGSEEAQAALNESQQRVHSMALIHELLYGSEHLDRVNFPDYARKLIHGLYGAFAGAVNRVSIELEADPIEMTIERAVPCALVLNELLSNAFKHAFNGGANGRILVTFRQSEPGWLKMAVEDDGIGLADGALERENSKSLGFRIVRILSKQLDGTLQREASAGTRLVLRFPEKARAAESRR